MLSCVLYSIYPAVLFPKSNNIRMCIICRKGSKRVFNLLKLMKFLFSNSVYAYIGGLFLFVVLWYEHMCLKVVFVE